MRKRKYGNKINMWNKVMSITGRTKNKGRNQIMIVQELTHDRIHEQHFPLIDVFWEVCIHNPSIMGIFITPYQDFANSYWPTTISQTLLHSFTLENKSLEMLIHHGIIQISFYILDRSSTDYNELPFQCKERRQLTSSVIRWDKPAAESNIPNIYVRKQSVC